MSTLKTLSLLLCLVGALRAQYFQHNYAVVVGIRVYTQFKELPNARADAESIAAFLKSQHYEVNELYDQRATRTGILEAIDSIAVKVKEHDRVLIFFAGHGYTETRGGQDWGYIVPFDGRSGTTSTLIGMEELRTQSERLGRAAHQLFLMDSCYGGSIGLRDIGGGVDPGVPNYLFEISRRVAREALTAGGRDQQVEDGAVNGHSRFTEMLLEALRDGKADLNSDGYITFSELSAYLLPRATTRLQTPEPAWLPGHGQGEYWFVAPKETVDFVFSTSGSNGAPRGEAKDIEAQGGRSSGHQADVRTDAVTLTVAASIDKENDGWHINVRFSPHEGILVLKQIKAHIGTGNRAVGCDMNVRVGSSLWYEVCVIPRRIAPTAETITEVAAILVSDDGKEIEVRSGKPKLE